MRKSLRAQLIIAIVLLAVVPLLLVGADTLRRIFNVERQQAIVLQQEIVRRVATQVETYIFSREGDLRLLLDVQGLPDMEVNQQKALLRSLSNSQDVYSELILVDSQGQTIVFESPVLLSIEGESRSYAETAIFNIPHGSGGTYYSPVQIDEESGEPFMTISIPFYDLQTGDFDGVLAANFRFRPMWTLMEDIRSEIKGFVYVIDNNGRVVAHPNRSVVLQRTQATVPSSDGFTAGLDGEEVVQAHQFISLGLSSLLRPQGLNVVAEVPVDEALELANSTLVSTITAVLVAMIIAGGVGTLVALRITRPIGELAATAQAISAGDLSRQVTVVREDEIGTLGAAFNSMTTQLRNLIAGLEQRVASRTQDLNLAAEIGRQVSQVRHLDQLLPQAAQLVQDRFELYQTQIYLVDESGEHLVLQASTGYAGTKLFEAGHTLPIDENSLNGTAASTKHAVIVADTAESPAFRPHPLLPDTRSEMAVPLVVGEKVVGVLDLQSDKPHALTEDNLSAFETLSGQLAIAIQNAALLNERRQAEAQVRENEALMRTIIDSTPDWIFVKDINHRYIVANKEFANTLEMTPDDIVGKNDLELGISEEVVKGGSETGFPGIWPSERKVLDSGQMEVVEEETTLITGQHVTLTTTRVPLRDLEGNLSGFVGFVHDITERKQFEKELQEAQARTQEILESINVPLVISRVSDGIVAYVNDPLTAMIRVPREELIGQITPDFYHDPADRETYLKGLREQGQVFNFDLRLKRGDGETLWTLASGRIINFQGNPAIITSLVDITDRREAQATVARRATELETVANVGTVATTILDPEELIQQMVDLTKERFNLYHTHLYLLDESKTKLVLTSGAGEVGAKMVAEGRRIELTKEQSLVARAARTQEGVVINNVQEEPGFLPHPLLPETQAELAVPLVVGNEVLGVLDVQANKVNRFTSEDINIFTTLASQVAVALQNARRHDEALKALDELTRLQRIMVREGWEDYLTTEERPYFGYSFNIKGAKHIQDADDEAVVARQTAKGKDRAGTETTDSSVTIPIAVRGELIGKIGLRNPDGSAISERKQSLIKTVAHQVSEALERARLTEQTQRALRETNEQARRLALLNELSETISRITTIEDIAATVINKVPDILGAKRLSLYLIDKENESMLHVVGVTGEATDVREGELIPLAASPMAQALEKRQIVADLFTSGEDSLQAYHVPLYASGRALGTFNVIVAANTELDEGDQQILLQIASLLSTTLENRRLFNQTKARADRERLLNNITQKIQSTVTMESALKTAVSELSQALKVKKAIIELSTNQNGEGHTQK